VILTRYILREHIAPFLYALFVITFLFLVDFIVRILSSILSKGLSWQVVLEILMLNLAWMLALSIPMAVLVSTLMAFGRFSSDNEITAMKSMGISPLKAMAPVMVVAFFLMAFMVWFNDQVLPQANFKAAELRNDITRKKPTALITTHQLITDFDNYKIWIDKLNQQTGVLQGIRIFREEGSKPLQYTYADSATMEYKNSGRTILIHLQSGENHLIDAKERENYVKVAFKKQTVAMENIDATLEHRERTYRTDRELPIQEMQAIVVTSKNRITELHKEYSEKIFDDIRAMDILMRGDTVRAIPPRLMAKPWLATQSLGGVIASQVLRHETDKDYLFSRFEQRIDAELKEINQYEVEIHKKFAIPMACLVFVFIGAPLGIMARRGGVGMGTVYSLIFFIIYWVGMLRGEVLADKLLLAPWIAMWGPNILIGLVGAFLVFRMVRENYGVRSR
jgi:lipopolysaccharide export system permease protein